MLETELERCTAESRQWQDAQRERQGIGASAELAELAHVLMALLRGRGYRWREALWAAHAAAVPTGYNWQGNRRLAKILGVCTRTAQRARAKLEADGLIRSHLLEPGDQLDGQRSPVRRPQVVRDVSRLQQAALRRLEWLRSGGRLQGETHAQAPSSRASGVPFPPAKGAVRSHGPVASTAAVATPVPVGIGIPARQQPSSPQERVTADEIDAWLALNDSTRRAPRSGQVPPRGT